VNKALRQAALAIVTLSAVALALSTGVVGTTSALFNGETQNAASSFAGGWVDPPSSLVATPSGYDVNFTWTAGTHGPVTGEQVWAAPTNGTNPNCTGAAYSLLATLATAGTTSYNDTRPPGTAANDGDWFCYELLSTSATVWTGQALKAVQVGLVASSISTANATSTCGGAPAPVTGKTDCNDTITITFNQKPILPASPIKVCTWSSGSIVIGDTNATACNAAGDAFSIGRMTGGTLGTSVKYSTSTYTLTTAAPWVMTITLKGSNTTSTVSGTWTFTPAAGILSTVTAHQATICVAAKTTCQPTSTTAF
jgi:hypothetical protein